MSALEHEKQIDSLSYYVVFMPVKEGFCAMFDYKEKFNHMDKITTVNVDMSDEEMPDYQPITPKTEFDYEENDPIDNDEDEDDNG